MNSRIARKIAQMYIEQNHTQPLRLQPDYNERNAQDFLGERSVAMNMGYGDRIHPGPGNAFEDEIVAEDFESDFLSELDAELDAEETESFEINDRMADFWKKSRLPSREHNSDKVVDDAIEQWKEDNPEIAKKFDEEKVNSKEEMMEKMKQADYDIIDDIGLGRMADDHNRGSYMSRQNLREMSDMADFIVDDIGMEGLDDWVEDKISQSYSAMSDVARYRGYRDDHHQHGEESFNFADDEIIDDLEY